MVTYDLLKGNDRLRHYIHKQFNLGKPFLIPRVAGIENNAAVHIKHFGVGRLLDTASKVLKNNAGLLLDRPSALQSYCDWYLKAFKFCDIYASWEPWSDYAKYINESQAYVKSTYVRELVSASVFDIFHFVARGEPWTHALKGKKILIVSAFVDLIRTQPQAYPVDLFPGCTFVYLKPPMTQGDEPNRGWNIEFGEFCDNVKGLDFDVALCSCGGYGNPICAYIFTLGKSAIYVGGVLQMYFGIYGTRWLKERKDVLNLYLSPDWVRPSHKPKGFEKIENGCYW
jgi:hypothetical protein